MLGILRHITKTGIVTARYPEAPEPAPPAFRGQVTIFVDRCSGDGACANACPSGAIVVSTDDDGGWSWMLNDAKCVFCGLCAEACPVEALTLSNDFELAVRVPRDLMALVGFHAGERGKGESVK